MYTIESPVPFSESRIWNLQQEYFTGVGIDAWRQGEVPQFITSNAYIARTYARLVQAFFADRKRLGFEDESYYILELGAGSGRFAYHFLREMAVLEANSPDQQPHFCYVASDIAPANLEFWAKHPRFQPFLGMGSFDYALFDATKDRELKLQYSGRNITAGDVDSPLITIGNYFFDTIPQELLKADGEQLKKAWLGLECEGQIETMPVAQILRSLHLNYSFKEEEAFATDHAEVEAVLDVYRNLEGYFLFPQSGIQCLQNLRQLFPGGNLLLSSDKGDHQLNQVLWQAPPQLVTHGSFSLNVNYHALNVFCEQQGGQNLTPHQPHFHLNVQGMMFLPSSGEYSHFKRAYEQEINEFGPDEFFDMMELVQETIPTLSVRKLLAALRLANYDPQWWSRLLPRLLELAGELKEREEEAVLMAVDRVWDKYFPLGESYDLAFEMGVFLFRMNYIRRALSFFEISGQIYGESEGTLLNRALCYERLGNTVLARDLARKIQPAQNHYGTAHELLKRIAVR